jgi:hypothetical protein
MALHTFVWVVLLKAVMIYSNPINSPTLLIKWRFIQADSRFIKAQAAENNMT